MINTPVVYSIFIRKELILKVMARIKIAKPRVFILVSDFGRNPTENVAVIENRRIVESMVDWECDFIKLYSQENIGVFGIYKYAMDLVFEEFEQCIFLEEDILPEIDFFRFADELLFKFKDDNSVSLISGMNPLGEYPKSQNPSYFFVDKSTPIWGHAIWKRTYQLFIENFASINIDDYSKNVIRHRLTLNGNFHWYEFFEGPNPKISSSMEKDLLGLSPQVLYHSLFVVPSINLTSNIGASLGSEHSGPLKTMPKRWRANYFQETFSLNFPLVHPEFKLADKFYYELLEKKYPPVGPIKSKFDRIERILRYAIYMDQKSTFSKIKNRLHCKKIK